MSEGTRPERITLPALLRAAGLFTAVAALLFLAFLFMRDSRAPKALIAVIALIIGIGGVWGLFYAGNGVIEALPRRLREAARPWLFVGPAILILCIYIVFPAVRTIWISFFDRTSQVFVGLANYAYIITDPEMLLVLRNTLLWVLLVPFFSVVLGLFDRGPDRPPGAGGRARHQGADLPAHGDLVRRRQRDLALRLLLSAGPATTKSDCSTPSSPRSAASRRHG